MRHHLALGYKRCLRGFLKNSRRLFLREAASIYALETSVLVRPLVSRGRGRPNPKGKGRSPQPLPFPAPNNFKFLSLPINFW